MKRYWILGTVITLVGVVLALVLNANSADEDKTSDFIEQKVTVEQLQQWLNNKNDAVYEIRNDEFYVQESIGSQGVSLTFPKKFFNDFSVSFKLLSTTETANVKMININTANGDTYSFEIRQRPEGYLLRVYHNGHSIAKHDGTVLEPNVFYDVKFEKKQKHVALFLNSNVVWQQDFPEGTGRKAIFSILLSGLPDHPAGVIIKDMTIYSQKK